MRAFDVLTLCIKSFLPHKSSCPSMEQLPVSNTTPPKKAVFIAWSEKRIIIIFLNHQCEKQAPSSR